MRQLSLCILSFCAVLPACAQSPSTFSPLATYSGILSDTAVADSQADGQTVNQPPKPPQDISAAFRPYTVGEKFKASSRNVFGPIALVGVGISAGLDQLTNTPSEFGQGGEGFAKRYASDFGTNFAHYYFGFVLEAALHQDPRYFPSKDRSAKARFKSVVRQTFLAHKDSGGETFAYARWGSAFGAGLVGNTWIPRSESHWGDGLRRGGYIIAIDSGLNLAEEFLPFFRHLRP